MKKIGSFVFIFILLLPIALLSGCYYKANVQPKNIYKKYITLSDQTADAYNGSYTEYIANEKAGAVVTVYSEYRYRNNKGTYSSSYEWRSGIILNESGYILTTGNAVRLRASDQSTTVKNVQASNIYIYLLRYLFVY